MITFRNLLKRLPGLSGPDGSESQHWDIDPNLPEADHSYGKAGDGEARQRIRDGGFRQFAPPLELGVMMLFWLFGLGGVGYFLAIPMVALSIAPGGIFVLQERTLRARRVTRFAISDASRPRLRKTRDSEGDDYYRIEVVLPEGRRVGVGGANDLGDAETRLAEMDHVIDGL